MITAAATLTKHQTWVLGMLARGKGYMVGNCRADRLAIEAMPAGLVASGSVTNLGHGHSCYVITEAGRAAVAA